MTTGEFLCYNKIGDKITLIFKFIPTPEDQVHKLVCE